MIESFVDLTYRGLPLGHRIKLTEVRPTTGYLELSTPMPVGTRIALGTDDGVALEAVVTGIHEQVGGSDRAPGMTVRPALTDGAAATWWKARVVLPEATAAKPAPRARSVTVRPRSHSAAPLAATSAPAPAPAPSPGAPLSTEVTATKEMAVYVAEVTATKEMAVYVAEVTATKEMAVYVAAAPSDVAPAVPHLEGASVQSTMIMNAVDQELLAKLSASDGQVEQLSRSGEHAVVDDGMRTMVMDALDPATLGIDVSPSGGFPRASSSGDADAGVDDDEAGEKPKETSGAVKKRKKKR